MVEELPIAQYRHRIENYMKSEDGDDVFFNLFIRGTPLAAIFNEQEIQERFADRDNGIKYRGFIIFSDYNIQLPAVDGENDITFIDGNMYVYLSPRLAQPTSCSALYQISMYSTVIVNLWPSFPHSIHERPAIPQEAIVRINIVPDGNVQLPDVRARDIYVGLWKPGHGRSIFKATIDSTGEVELHADPETNSLYVLAHELSLDYLEQTIICGEWAARPTTKARSRLIRKYIHHMTAHPIKNALWQLVHFGVLFITHCCLFRYKFLIHQNKKKFEISYRYEIDIKF